MLRLDRGPFLAPGVTDLFQWGRHEEETVQFGRVERIIAHGVIPVAAVKGAPAELRCQMKS